MRDVTPQLTNRMQPLPRSKQRQKKYEPLKLVEMFRLAAELRARMVAVPGVNYLGRSTSIILAGGSEA